LNVGVGNGLTIEAWIKPANLGAEYVLAEWNDGATIGAHFAINTAFNGQGGPGCLYANLRDINGIDHYFFSAPGLVSPSVWQHVAVNYDRTSGIAKLFCNGLTVASAYLGVFVPRTTADLHLGYRPGYISYAGLLDESAIYNRALTTAEVFTLYVTDAAGKCHDRPVFTSSFQFADATQGSPYTQQVTTVLGALPVGFSISAGSLPSGLSLSSLGLISGVPTTAGSNVFAVLATDAAGLSTELICGLKVLPDVLPVSAMPAGLVAWWQAENNSLDTVGTNHGTLSNGVAFAGGEVGQAFLFSSPNQEVRIAAAPALNLGAGNGMTIEAWAKPANLSTQYTLIEWNDGSTIGAHVWLNVAFGGQGGPGCIYANLRDIGSTDHFFFSPANLLSTNAWSHVAVTYDPVIGVGKLFFNGAAVATANLGIFVPRTTTDLHLGYRPGSPANTYAGLVDEPALYNRVLSTNEIAGLYLAGPLGKVNIGPYFNTPSALPDAVLGVGYTQTITSVRGSAPVTYAVTGGTPPPGLSLSSTGLLSGTPAAAGSFNFTVRATDAGALSNSHTFALQVCARIPPPAGMVSWWRAEDNAFDAVGTNIGILANGASFAPGKVGRAFSLDGVNDSVEIADAPSLRPASLSVEGWVWFSAANGVQLIFAKPVGPTFYDSYAVWLENGTLRGVIGDAASSGTVSSFPFSPDLGQWYHVAFTFDDATKQQALYLNGLLVASNIVNRSMAYDNHPTLLGRDDDSGNPVLFFSGRIDEAALYDRALTTAEIAGIYNAGLAGRTAVGPYFTNAPVLSDAIAGLGYTQFLGTVRGAGPVTSTLMGGALPSGLTLSAGGLLSGTPTTVGRFSFTVRATDTGSLTADRVFALQVLPKLAPAAGLAGWWRAENNALDAQGTSDGVVVNGATFAPGKVGQSFALDGVDDTIEIADTPALRPASVTLEVWVLFFSANGNQHIIAKPLGTGTSDSFVMWYENGNLRGLVSDIAGGYSLVSVAFTPVLGRWYHVAFTFDDNTKQQWLYLDGIAVATGLSNRMIGYDSHALLLGGDIDNGSLANLFLGRIDEAALYNRALGPSEIASLYNAGSGGKTSSGPYLDTPPLLPAGILGRAYTQTLTSVRGVPPVTYALAGGALPGGLTLSATGLLSGTPTTIGASTFVVRATDAVGLSGDQSFTLDVFSHVLPPAGLVSWWRAENNGLDSAGSNHAAVANGASYAAGQAGQAFSLDGVNDYMQVTDAPSLRPLSVTLETWVLFTSAGTRVLLGKPVGGGSSDSYQIYLSGGTLGAFVGDASGAGIPLSIPFSPTLGRWYHVAYTFDDATLQQVLYLDGITVASSLGNKRIGYDSQPVLLGCDIDNGSRSFFFPGRIDETAIYNRALTAEEIAAVHDAGAAGKSTNGPYFSTAPLLPDGVLGRAYTQAITTLRGTAPVLYTLIQGALPDGLSLDSNGVLSGTPSAAGASSFVVRATDSSGLVAEQFYALQVFASVPSPAGLLAWWRGDNSAQDSAGTNHGIMSGGAAFGTGKVLSAFDLNGTNAFVAIPNSGWLNPAGAFSVEVWIKASPQQFGSQFIVVDKSHGFTDSTGWALQGNPDGTVSFFFGKGGGGALNFSGVNTLASVLDDHWHHLVGVFTGTQISLHEDSLLQNTLALTNIPAGNTRDLEIGRSWGGGAPTRYFHGLIDEVSFYGRALALGEITALYSAGPAGKSISAPAIVLSASVQGQVLTLSFNARVGKTYTIQYSDALNGGLWPPLTNLIALNTNVIYADSITNSRRFYRVITPGN
jgi:hypothetical protein